MSQEVSRLCLIALLLVACTTQGEEAATTSSSDSSTTTSSLVTTTTMTTAPECAAHADTANPSPPSTRSEDEPSANTAPTVEITAPVDLSSHVMELNEGRNCYEVTLEFSAESSDPDGADFILEWFSSDEGFLGEGDQIEATLHTIRSDTAQPVITARATDEWGAVSEDQVQIIIWIPSDT